MLRLLIALIKIFSFFGRLKNKNKLPSQSQIPTKWRTILRHRVQFYNRLSNDKKKEFEDRMQYFIRSVKYTGINTTVTDIDRVLVASGAVVTLFGFKKWHFSNLQEVLIHPDDFIIPGTVRKVRGLVGYGAMEGRMMLSRKALIEGFSNSSDGKNVAIHEFIHIMDKEDGEVDGVLSDLMNEIDISPWIHLIHHKMDEIEQGRSGIRKYGAANQVEFLSVASELFFENPEKMISIMVTIHTSVRIHHRDRDAIAS